MEGIFQVDAISQIKLTDFMTASIILTNTAATAKEKQAKSDTPDIGITVTIINYDDAKDEANQTNQVTHSIVGTNQAATEAIGAANELDLRTECARLRVEWDR